MVHTEGARLMTVDELIELMNEDFANPTLDRLFFIETRKKDGTDGKLFPIFLEGYAYEEGMKGPVAERPEVSIRGCVIGVQSGEGEFTALRVMLHEKEIGDTKRIWDKPPTAGLRKDNKWPGEKDEEVVLQ